MRMEIAVVIVGMGWVLGGAAASLSAHHAFAAEFDAKKATTFKGTVTKMEWINPHVWIHINVTKGGKTEEWMAEGGAPSVLFRRGFTKTSLQPGVEIVVDGYQAKDGTNKMNAREVTFADGRKLFAGASGTGAPDQK